MDISGFRISCINLSDQAVSAQMVSFQSEWDDEVHESFMEFNDFIRRSASKINEDANQCTSVLQSVEDIDVPTLISDSEAVCQVASSF